MDFLQWWVKIRYVFDHLYSLYFFCECRHGNGSLKSIFLCQESSELQSTIELCVKERFGHRKILPIAH
jgi:hypothetical protein